MNGWAPESLKTPGSKEKHRNQTISVRFQLVHLGECFLLPPVKIFGQFAGVQELTPFINDRLSLAHFPGVHWFHNKSKLGSCWPQTNIALPSRGLNMFFNCEVCFRFWGAGDNIWKKKDGSHQLSNIRFYDLLRTHIVFLMSPVVDSPNKSIHKPQPFEQSLIIAHPFLEIQGAQDGVAGLVVCH